MSFITAAIVGGTTLLGGYMASKGAQSAAKTQAAAATQSADTQAQAAREALALQEKMYERQIGLQEPYRQAGLTGQNRLMTLLGLRGQQPTEISGGGIMGDIGRAASRAASGPYVGGDATSADFGKYAKDFSMAGFDPSSLMRNFQASDFQQDPGYAFRLKEGQKALERSAAARGGLISGGALKAATGYGQEMGSQEYQNAYNRFQANRAVQAQEYGNAFNRYQTERANQLQPLGNLMASGQSAASNMGSAAGQYGTAGANLLTGAGQAIGAGQYGAGQSIAAGQLGAGNTMSNALGTIGSAYQTNQLLNRFYPVGGQLPYSGASGTSGGYQ